MKYRKVEGEEREKLLSSRKPAGFNYQPYLDVMDGMRDGDVVAVELDNANEQRGEKIRFSRAARLEGKSLTWLSPENPNEIVFQVGPMKTKRTRDKRV